MDHRAGGHHDHRTSRARSWAAAVAFFGESPKTGESMDLGPVEILVVRFPGNQFTGEVAPALAELVQTGLIRVIDLVFVTKDADGDVVGIELSDLDDATGAAFQPHVEVPSGLLADEDIQDLAADLAPN